MWERDASSVGLRSEVTAQWSDPSGALRDDPDVQYYDIKVRPLRQTSTWEQVMFQHFYLQQSNRGSVSADVKNRSNINDHGNHCSH